MKKLIAFALALTLAISLAACADQQVQTSKTPVTTETVPCFAKQVDKLACEHRKRFSGLCSGCCKCALVMI